jgi:hypothetical protein
MIIECPYNSSDDFQNQIIISTPILCDFDNRINDKIHNYIDEPCLCFSQLVHEQFKEDMNKLLKITYNRIPILINNNYQYKYSKLEKLIANKRKYMKK